MRRAHTSNMLLMTVTLDVLKLSGWLNLVAPCRLKRRAYDARRGAGRGRREGVGRRRVGGTSGIRGEGPTTWLGARARAERTLNMPCMIVTLDVSKLSGLLNLIAFYRAERTRSRGEVRGPGGGRAWGSRGASSARGEARLKGEGCGGHRARTPNMCFMSVTLDVSKLSGLLYLYVNCQVEGGACDGGGAGCGGDASGGHVHGRGGERTRNIPFMSVTLDVSKLSGLLNFFAFCMPDRN